MKSKTIAILASLDTKGEEASFLRNLIEERGHRVLFIDTSTGSVAAIHAEYPAEEVAAAGLNALTEDLFKRIAGAICGMVEMQGTPPSSWKGSRGKGNGCADRVQVL